jgi:hypothetical protein
VRSKRAPGCSGVGSAGAARATGSLLRVPVGLQEENAMRGRTAVLFISTTAILVLLTPATPGWAQRYDPEVRVNPMEQVSVFTYGGTLLELTNGPPIDNYASSGPIEADSGVVRTTIRPDLDAADGYARADFGVLAFSGWAQGGGPTEPDHLIGGGAVWGGAWSNDYCTISSPGLDGTSGTVKLHLSTTGYYLYGGASLVVNDDPTYHSWPIRAGAGSLTVHWGDDGSFVFGQLFQVELELAANATANYEHHEAWVNATAELTGISAYDGAGNPVTDYTLTCLSANDYGFLFRDGFESGDIGRWSSASP